MIDVKGFLGILDSDNPPSGVAMGGHMMAFNGRFKGVNGLLQYQNVEGNREIVFTKPAGDNECIGAFYDAVENVVYWCNWNSNSSHAIYVIDMATESVLTILESGVNTDGDILNFDLDSPIHSMDLMYGSDGNFLSFVDSLGRPTEIDLNKFLNDPYTLTKRAYIDVAKAPFVMPPKVSYENDETATANNFRNALFQFRYRPVYLNNEKSVNSSASEVPLPYLPFDQTLSKDPTINARICVYVETGDANVKEIEIIGRQNSNGIISDWFKITVLNKAELGIADNSIYRYLFLNDSAYPTIPTEGTDFNTQVLNLQDYVPKIANTQCLLNGNVLGYAGITEGFDKVVSDIQIFNITTTDGRVDAKNGILFFANQNSLFSVGTGNITIYLAGVGENDVNGNPTTLSNSLNAKFYVRAQTSLEVSKSFFYTATSPNQSVASVLAGISTAAQAQGFTQVSLSGNTLVLSLAGAILLSSQIFTNEAVSANEAIYANAERASYAYGVQYFDDKGRTNGVTYGASFNTLPDAPINDQFELRIYHRPPLWATYYHVVRTNNITYNKLLNWVSESAFSNRAGVDNTLYAYIGISNIAAYNEEISSTAGVVSYEFQKGDRVRFIGRALDDGTIDKTGFDDLDYEILGVQVNPIVSGVNKNGTYLKILYPTSDISTDFKFDGTAPYQNYQIQLYSVADRVSKDLQLFYDWAQQYGIGNAGTPTAYHAGMTQSQTSTLSQPAKILIDKGDWFRRYRKVLAGASYFIPTGGYSQNTAYSTLQVDVPGSPVVEGNYKLVGGDHLEAGIDDAHYPTYMDNDETIANISATRSFNIRVRGTQTYTPPPGDPFFEMLVKVVDSLDNITLYTLVALQQALSNSTTYEYTFDATIAMTPLSKAWLLIHNNGNGQVGGMQLRLDVINDISIPIIEKSFSDLYDLELNANCRVTVIDENAAEIYYPTKFRWGLSYLQDTNINNVNRFYAANYDEWDRSKGDVRRLVARERVLKVFQAKGVGVVGIYTKFVQDSGSTNLLTTTDDIITKNNINYYQGEYGMGSYPTSLVSTDAVDIFVDPIRGYQIISDLSGLRAINELYLGQYYIRGLLSEYNKEWTKTDGSRAKIMGVYNYVDEEYNCILEGGTNGGDTIDDYNFSFNLKRHGYSSFFDWHPEWSISVEEKIITWKDGGLWVHDNTETYCNFFSAQSDCNITLPFNKNQIEKKGWKGVVEQSNTIWTCPEIYTQVMSYGTTPQASNLIASDFFLKEGMFHASFLRDSNSVKGINNGDKLKGTYMVVKFQPISSADFVFLTSISVRFLDSPLVPA